MSAWESVSHGDSCERAMQDTQSIRPLVTFYQRKENEAEGPQIPQDAQNRARSEAECTLILWNHMQAFAQVIPVAAAQGVS